MNSAVTGEQLPEPRPIERAPNEAGISEVGVVGIESRLSEKALFVDGLGIARILRTNWPIPAALNLCLTESELDVFRP